MSNRPAIIAAISALLNQFPGRCIVRVETGGRELAKFDLSQPAPEFLATDPCKQAIYQSLQNAGHRLTTMELLSVLAREGVEFSERTVKEKLSEMVDEGVLDNDQKARPKGYGIRSA